MTDTSRDISSYFIPFHNDLTDDGKDFQTIVTKVNALIEDGKWDDAYPYLKRSVEIDPNYAEGYNHLGVFYTRNKNYIEAINNFKKALQINFALTEAHYNLASVYMERKEYHMALPHFKEVVLANPNDYETYYLMGQCSFLNNMEKDAYAFFSESYRLKPDHIPSAINLCKLLIRRENYTKAKNTLLAILKNNESIPEIHFLLGVIYKIEKKYPRAMKHFRETLLEDKGNTEAYNLIGECCVELGMDEQAESFFTMAIKLNPSYVSVFYKLGDLYYRQKRYIDAISTLEEYIKTKEATDSINALWSETMNTNNEEIIPIYNLLGRCYQMTHDPMKARSVWEKSLAIKSEQPDIKDALANLPQPAHVHRRISLVID
jgi:tetratricopeptide (TPR) repeat protein